MAEPKYKRVLIKLSGEALAGERGVGIDLPTVQAMAKEIAEVADSGIQIALVIGGGNLWRGEPAAEAGMDRVQADYTGMLGTTMNALVMADSLKQLGVDTRVQTAIDMKSVAEPYTRIDDEFLTNLGMTRMAGTKLNFGSNKGWIAFEIKEDASGLTLSYPFESETYSCELPDLQ